MFFSEHQFQDSFATFKSISIVVLCYIIHSNNIFGWFSAIGTNLLDKHRICTHLSACQVVAPRLEYRMALDCLDYLLCALYRVNSSRLPVVISQYICIYVWGARLMDICTTWRVICMENWLIYYVKWSGTVVVWIGLVVEEIAICLVMSYDIYHRYRRSWQRRS